jgi:tRNA(Ile2) C34 agmatinyltransferase TiaS
MPTYLICNNLHRTQGIVLNSDCYVILVGAKSRQQALKDYTENYSAIPLSQFTPRERQQIYRALGKVVPQCCGRVAALDSLNYWRCRSCKTYYPRNPGRPRVYADLQEQRRVNLRNWRAKQKQLSQNKNSD